MALTPDISEQQEYALAASEVFSSDDGLPPELNALGVELLSEFAQAELDRRQTEERWLKDLRQYRGIYDPDIESRIGPVRSKSFMRKTRTKVKSVDSRVADLLFPAGADKNWEISASKKPKVSPDQQQQVLLGLQQAAQAQQKQAAMQQAQAVQQAQQQGQQVPANAQPPQMPKISQDQIDTAIKQLADDAAKAMSDTMEDQLEEARYKDACMKAIHSGHLYGTGILKGPLVDNKVVTTFVQKGNKWAPMSEVIRIPFVDFVPVWRFYPDMAATSIEQCRYAYERHQMTSADMADLAARKSFDKVKIIDYIRSHPSGEIRTRYVDNELKIIGERNTTQGHVVGQYEVLERWGWLRGEQLAQVGIDVPQERLHESFFSNCWLLPNGELIKCVLQPINGVTWPYHFYHFDKDETSLFCEGIPSIMRDEQMNLNAAVRMILDNASITSGAMVEVSPHLLSDHDRIDEMAPWKAWMRNSQSPGQPAVRAIELPNNLQALSAMKEMFEANADEVTSIPRFFGDAENPGASQNTAQGMSMLLGSQNIVIKDLVSYWDEGITRTFLDALYKWNMQFNPDNRIKGDFDVKATGSASLVAKEVRSRQLNDFAAQTSNPMDAPYIKRDVLNKRRAEANEICDLVRTQEEVDQINSSGPAAAQQQFQEALQQLQLQKLQGEIQLSAAKVARDQAETALSQVKAMSLKVDAIFAALQAGGVATQSPQIAPAGDEILRSSGFQDSTPDPSISQLMGQEVQSRATDPMQQGVASQASQVQPAAQGPQGGPPPGVTPGDTTMYHPDPAKALPAMEKPPTTVHPASGHVGQHHGIETTRITD